MSQHDLNIANQGFPAFRSDLNNALVALGTMQSGTTEPATMFANQLWYDTTNNVVKMRNADNDAWIALIYLDQVNDEILKIAGLTTGSTGSIEIPNGTTGQRDVSPSAGWFRFNTTLGKFEGYNGSIWGSVGGGATGGGSDEVFIENSTTVNTNYTLTTGKNAMSVGSITVGSGITVTVPSGARWVVL